VSLGGDGYAGRSSYNSPLDFRIAQSPPDNIPPEVRGVLLEIYAGMQQVIKALVDECGIAQQNFSLWPELSGSSSTIKASNMRRLYVQASEDIALGAMVNLHNVAGNLRARNANATNNTKPSDGFCNTVGGIIAGEVGEIILACGVATVLGLTVGSRYFLSTSNGLVTATAPVAAGNIEQYIGVALSTTQLFVNTGYWIQH
jgi:hypothetical protein